MQYLSPRRQDAKARSGIASGLASLLLCAFALSPLRVCAATNDLSGLLQKGLFEEEANRNLEAAVQAYQSLVTAFDQDRKLAATAVFRLGECYRKLGKTNEAVLQYERIVREFADEAPLATLSRQNLAGLGAKNEGPVSSTRALDARQEQKRLVEDEIKLLEQDLVEAKKRYETGVGPQADLRNKEREILKLRRQMAEMNVEGNTGRAATLRNEIATAEGELAWLEEISTKDSQLIPSVLAIKNDELKDLLQYRSDKEQALAKLKTSYSAEHPMVKATQTELDSVGDKINTCVRAEFAKHKVKLGLLRRELVRLENGDNAVPPGKNAVSSDLGVWQKALVDAELGHELTTVQIKQIESSGRDERLQLVLTVPGLSTTMLQLLLEELSRAEADLRELKKDHADEHPEVASKRKQLDLVWQRLDKQVEAVIKVLKVRREALQETIKLLQPRIAQASSQADAAPKSNGEGTVPTDEEETEIRRLQAMIQNSPDLINGPGAGGMTPLCQAANKGQLRVAQFLLDHGAAIDRKANNMTPLHDAVARGHETMVELLLQRGADVNARDGTGGTALHEAAQDGFLSVAEVLVQHKADLNVRNSQMNDEQTPLHRAIEKGFTEMATFLVSKGADVNAQTKRGRSPLGVAASRGHMKILSELLGAGAKLDLEDKDGLTPLAYAVSGGHLDCARKLLAAGANPNAGKDGGALCWPGPVSVPEGVRLLLEAGANPNAKRADGQTPLLTATEKGYHESAVVLLKHGADVNATNNFGMTPLQMAVWAESLPMVSLLLTNHANVNAPGPVGRNALIMAKEAEGGFRPYTPGDYGGRSRTPDKEVARKIANLLRQHGAKEGSPTSEAARPPEKP